ncbi:hypothetical protein JCM19240_4916 [Vibrio maritimus]|uniref:Uncharacterized protein n=1 Tax=Vibrio maritimus TaxID=990268 RepID=A0A090T7U7_9VIBR|nr:hypothetical protein JCM19240_4916 [Vibrio maritimus]
MVCSSELKLFTLRLAQFSVFSLPRLATLCNLVMLWLVEFR